MNELLKTADQDNAQFKLFENVSLTGTHYKHAIAYTWKLSTDFKRPLIIVPFPKSDPAPGLSFRYGNGHLRNGIKEILKKYFGREDPAFYDLYDLLQNHPAARRAKDHIITCC